MQTFVINIVCLQFLHISTNHANDVHDEISCYVQGLRSFLIIELQC